MYDHAAGEAFRRAQNLQIGTNMAASLLHGFCKGVDWNEAHPAGTQI